MASTMGLYLTQTSTFLAPASIEAASIALRQLAFWLLEHTDVTAIASVTRDDIEDFAVWLADQPDLKGPVLSANTRSYDDAPRGSGPTMCGRSWPSAPPCPNPSTPATRSSSTLPAVEQRDLDAYRIEGLA